MRVEEEKGKEDKETTREGIRKERGIDDRIEGKKMRGREGRI